MTINNVPAIVNLLPGIMPTARTFTMGQWPQKRVKMRNGRTAHWGLCNKPSGDKMDLAWENITYLQAETLCRVWDDNYGIYGSLSQAPSIPLTEEILAGTSGELKTLLALPFPGSSWHFAGPPRVEAVKAGRCSVRIPIKLRGQAFYLDFVSPPNPPVPPLGGAQKLTLPAYTPSDWELTLPGYPVITSSFRSASYPDILGSLPSESRWKLTYENMTNTEALALLLPWKGSGCGIWPLGSLPAETAEGVDDEDFRKRLIGTTWAIERGPVMQSVKNGRFTITIDLIHELTFESVYGPRNAETDASLIPVRLNMSNVMSVVALATIPLPSLENADGVFSLTLESGLTIVEPTPLSLLPLEDADAVLDLALGSELAVIELAILPLPFLEDADAVLDMALESGLTTLT